MDGNTGRIVRVAGPVVGAEGLAQARLYDAVQVGALRLVGEIIRLDGRLATIQVYEETSGVQIGEPVRTTGAPLVVQLGPGLLGGVYDGLQRSLAKLAEQSGYFIERGGSAPPLAMDKRWMFTPCCHPGDRVSPGQVLGTIPESEHIEHRIMVPPAMCGRLIEIDAGEYTIEDVVAVIETEDEGGKEAHRHEITLVQRWPVRQPRPSERRLDPRTPLIAGTRVIDALFPAAKGGAAIIPGGFGTGKTVLEQSLARWANVDVVVYVGCGERGNEMTEVLEEFPQLTDPRTGASLMQRTVLIANTSNMPVAAREASIYTGISIAEYYRDMGYDVLLLADSTSRWGEALREISGRLEEMPGEEGYPAYLATRLAAFYERSGRVMVLGAASGPHQDDEGRSGSVTIVGAVSPPGGDFSEPMTQNSMRLAATFWALDQELARRRHYPAVNWTQSYSLDELGDWYRKEVAEDWNDLAGTARALLQREDELMDIVQLVGPDALSESEQTVLFAARMIREDFLQQSAFDEVDRFCPLDKAYWMLKVILDFYDQAREALARGASLARIRDLEIVSDIARMKEIPIDSAVERLIALHEQVHTELETLG